MGMTRVIYVLFLTFIILPDVRNEVTCKWADSIPSECSCYLYNTSELSYENAQASCQSLGGLLAKVTTMTQLLDSTKNVDNYTSVWIGANDKDVEGTWMWEDGSVATELYEFWSKSKKQPSNKTAEDCADIYKDDDQLEMFDDKCSDLYPFMCMEKVEITTPCHEATTRSTSDPAATLPTTNDPASTELTTNDPASTEPTRNDSATNEPTTNDSATHEPTTNDSATNEPTTNDSAANEPTTNAILTSTSTAKCPNNSAKFIEFNVLLLFLLCVVIYLVI